MYGQQLTREGLGRGHPRGCGTGQFDRFVECRQLGKYIRPIINAFFLSRDSIVYTANDDSQFLTSRVSTPVPFKPKHLRQFSEAEQEALERLNLNANSPDSPSSPLRTSTTAAEAATTPSKLNMETRADSVTAKKIDFDLLEKKAEAASVNGHKEEKS